MERSRALWVCPTCNDATLRQGEGFCWGSKTEPHDEAELVQVEYVHPDDHRGAVAALRKYGRHGADCALMRSVASDNTPRSCCDCGWEQTSSQLLGGQ